MADLATRSKATPMHILGAVAGNTRTAQRRRVFARWRRRLVALITPDLGVQAFQLVRRSGVVIKRPQRPSPCVMAVLATHAQGLLVFVIFFMACQTVAWSIPITGAVMATFAFDNLMATGQRKSRPCVVKIGFPPSPVGVAALATIAQLRFVPIVLFVARDAGQRRTAHALQVFVARDALKRRLGVGVAQGKLGLVMREAPFGGLPFLRAVAIGAGFAQIATVLVILLVAAVAILRSLPEQGALVTGLAFGIGMLAEQRKLGFGVVKLGRLLPRLFAVATVAIATQRLLVFIVFLMAAIAILLQFVFVQIAGVTVFANGAPVLAFKQVFGIGVVIEHRWFPGLGGVTGFALVAKQAFVSFLVVHFAVARHTGFGGVFVDVIAVAIRTFHIAVFAG